MLEHKFTKPVKKGFLRYLNYLWEWFWLNHLQKHCKMDLNWCFVFKCLLLRQLSSVNPSGVKKNAN